MTEILDNIPRYVEWADLLAQQEMAKWARFMFWATVASLALSLGALIGLFLSLRQTSLALRENKQLGQSQARAYVHVASARHSWTDGGYALLLDIENVGETPAKFFEVGGILLKAEVGKVSAQIIPRTYNMKRWAALGGKSKLTVRLDTTAFNALVIEFGRPLDGHVLLVTGTVRYADIFDSWHETDFSFYSYTSETGSENRNNKLRRPTTNQRSYTRVVRPVGTTTVSSEEL
ncbi:MAG: hypothetical protein U5N27_02055 [Rhizobium sp.]|nr:hypothetical protein [Rhizobium sp.]